MRVFGLQVDDQTRCVHWHGATDVVALRFACCDRYYPCLDCHAADAATNDGAGHRAARWPRSRFGEPAVLCGACRRTMTVDEYRSVSACPGCAAQFNPGCASHAALYFDLDGDLDGAVTDAPPAGAVPPGTMES